MVVWRLGSRNVGIGQVAVNWLALSWISTVILGIPIAKAVFGDESIGQTYGFLAGISRYVVLLFDESRGTLAFRPFLAPVF